MGCQNFSERKLLKKYTCGGVSVKFFAVFLSHKIAFLRFKSGWRRNNVTRLTRRRSNRYSVAALPLLTNPGGASKNKNLATRRGFFHFFLKRLKILSVTFWLNTMYLSQKNSVIKLIRREIAVTKIPHCSPQSLTSASPPSASGTTIMQL